MTGDGRFVRMASQFELLTLFPAPVCVQIYPSQLPLSFQDYWKCPIKAAELEEMKPREHKNLKVEGHEALEMKRIKKRR